MDDKKFKAENLASDDPLLRDLANVFAAHLQGELIEAVVFDEVAAAIGGFDKSAGQ